MKTTLLFGIHCHQPVDNFDWVISDAIEKSYKPFFQTLEKYPNFKISVHFSGSLFEFIEKNDKELFELMKKLSSQIEFFSGGYYEPVLASIPSNDRVGQIKKLNNYIKKHFKQKPKGLWLTERVWDNAVLKDIKSCGIEYVIVDDYHISCSALGQKELNGYFLTEEGGESLALFPINKKLRYAIPFYSLEDTNTLLNSFKNNDGQNAAVIFDDGEKFGIWPKTYETVYEKKWLEDFIEQTLADTNIEVETFSGYYKNNLPISLSYLPTVSYFEMSQWSLGADDAQILQDLEELFKNDPQKNSFVKGGTWKNFLTKYQESNWIHKRVLELSKKQITNKKYIETLYKAQCNDVLWHGVFGGIYLPNLRDNAYKYIIECENILSQNLDQKDNEKLDIDMDGQNEYKFHSQNLLTIVSSKNGGQIFELDILNKNFNLQNTMTRYKESYHKDIVVANQDENQEEKRDEDQLTTIHDTSLSIENEISLDYDWYMKKSAIDHIVNKDITIEQFESNSFTEYGDFANQEFEVLRFLKKGLYLQRKGGIYRDTIKTDTDFKKSYQFRKDQIDIQTQIDINKQNNSFDLELHYLQEWNFHFSNLKDIFFNSVQLEQNKQYSNLEIFADHLRVFDKYLNTTILFQFDRKIKIYISTLNSISQSEKGVDLTNQGVSMGFLFDLKENFSTKVQLKID